MSNRSWITSTALVALLVGLIGCGGGGGGGGGGGFGSGGGATPEPGQYIEFTRVSGGATVDPLNLKVGDVVQMVLANYDLLGSRTVLFTGSWTATVGSGILSLDSVTGRFTVLSSPFQYFQFQTTSFIAGSNTLFSQLALVPTATASVTGRVVDLAVFSGLPTNTGAPFIQVDFFNSSGTRLGSARTNETGWFVASVPTSVVRMMVQSDSIPTSKYFRSVTYQNLVYSPLDAGCRISIGPLGSGSNSLASPLALPPKAGSIPSPPNGCS